MTVALAATALVSAQAQSEFKPLAGSVTTDFSLFANGIFNQTESPVALGSHAGINAGLIKGRYFLQDNIALRLSLGLNNSSSTQKTTDPVTEATTKSNVFTFGLGLEHHFGGTDRLSPYIGAELFLGSATGSTKSVNSAATTISKNAPRFVFGGDLLLIILKGKGYLLDEALSFVIVGDPLSKVLDLAHLGFGAGAIFPEGRVCRTKLFFF